MLPLPRWVRSFHARFDPSAGARHARRPRRAPPPPRFMKTPPAIIVLAAGKGSRFLGTDHKLAQRLGSATVLATTLRHAIASQLPVVVVTTARFADLARRGVAARDVVILPEADVDPGFGMGHSIAAGVA